MQLSTLEGFRTRSIGVNEITFELHIILFMCFTFIKEIQKNSGYMWHCNTHKQFISFYI